MNTDTEAAKDAIRNYVLAVAQTYELSPVQVGDLLIDLADEAFVHETD